MQSLWGRVWRTAVGLGGVAALGVAGVELVAACSAPAAEPATVPSGPDPGGGKGMSGSDGSTGPGTTTSPSGPGVTTIASGVHSPQALALDAAHVYWTTSMSAGSGATISDASTGTGSIERADRSGGGLTEIVTGLVNPLQLAIFNGSFFFAQGNPGAGVIDSFTLTSTIASEYVTTESTPFPMLVYQSTLYWAGSTGSALKVNSIPTLGGTISTLVTDAHAFEPIAIVQQGTAFDILATMGGDGFILEVPVAGGTPVQLWRGSGLVPADLAVNGSSLYWSLPSTPNEGGEILGMNASAGASVVTLATHLDHPTKLASSGGELYATTFVASGAVLALGLGGGAVTTLASGLDYPLPIVVDDAIYFGTATTVGRVAK
jgi:hypothetical protein